MEELLKTLYIQEIERFRLDFDHNPEYQKYNTQVQELWEGEDMPDSVFHLLDTGNFLSFTQGFLLGMGLARWCDSFMDKGLEHFC